MNAVPLTLFFHTISYDEFNPKVLSHTSYWFCNSLNSLWEWGILTICHFGTRYVIYRQTERWHLLPVINPMEFAEDSLWDNSMSPTFYCSLSYICLHKYQCCVLSLSRSDMAQGSVILLTPCPQETGLTSLLLAMIDQLTCYCHMIHHEIIYQKSTLIDAAHFL